MCQIKEFITIRFLPSNLMPSICRRSDVTITNHTLAHLRRRPPCCNFPKFDPGDRRLIKFK